MLEEITHPAEEVAVSSFSVCRDILGIVSGVFASGFNIGGLPLVTYRAMRGWKPSVFRASL